MSLFRRVPLPVATGAFFENVFKMVWVGIGQGRSMWPFLAGGIFLTLLDHFVSPWASAGCLVLGAGVIYVVLRQRMQQRRQDAIEGLHTEDTETVETVKTVETVDTVETTHTADVVKTGTTIRVVEKVELVKTAETALNPIPDTHHTLATGLDPHRQPDVSSKASLNHVEQEPGDGTSAPIGSSVSTGVASPVPASTPAAVAPAAVAPAAVAPAAVAPIPVAAEVPPLVPTAALSSDSAAASGSSYPSHPTSL